MNKFWPKNKNKTKMNNQQKSASIHRHIHYHYHYDVDNQLSQIGQRTPSRGSILQNKNDMKSSRLTWKDHIDPQVTRLYDEIYGNESLRGEHVPRTSVQYHSKRPASRLTQIVSSHEQNPLSKSRIQLMHQIEIYEEYLKKRNVSNLYVPNKTFLQNKDLDDTLNPQKFVDHVPTSTTLDDMIRKKVDSKIIGTEKMYQSTTAKDSCLKLKESELSGLKSMGKSKAQSEIKITQVESGLQKPKNATSQIFKSSKQINLIDQNPEFSLFQKSGQEVSCIKPKQQNLQSLGSILNNEQNQKVQSPYFTKKAHNDSSFTQYKYELVKEQCDFLRTKFIEHIETSHGIKF